MPKKEKGIAIVNVRLVKDSYLYSDTKIETPKDVIRIVKEEFKNYDREVFAIINLKTSNEPINVNICNIGTLNAMLISPREIFKSAILSNAASFIGVHNHPSGNLKPSAEDKMITEKLINCGKLLGINMLDHIIVGGGSGELYSFRENGIFGNLQAEFSEFNNNVVMEGRNSEVSYSIGNGKNESICVRKETTIINNSENMEVKKMEKSRVYLNVHNNFAKLGLESKSRDGRTFNVITLPIGSIVDGKDLSGGRIYPIDGYVYPNKFNPNLTTVQFKPEQEVQVNFRSGENARVKASDLCKAVDTANKSYLSQKKDMEKVKVAEKNKEAEKEL